MKNKILLALLLVTLCVLPAYAQAAAQTGDCSVEGALNVKNSTGIDIKAIYIARAGTEEWSENLLKPEMIFKRGETAAFPLERGGSFHLWTMKTVDAKGREVLREKLPLSFVYDLELTAGGKSKYHAIMRDT